MINTRRSLLLLLISALWVLAAGAQVTVIKAGKLVDAETGNTLSNQVILIEGTKITAVGSNLNIPPDAKLIDLSHETVLPGMVDAHTHMCLGFRLYGTMQNTSLQGYKTSTSIVDMSRSMLEAVLVATLTDTTGYRAIQGVANARSMLEAGFTTIRDVGNNGNYADTDLRKAIEAGIVPGPTMINAGRIIAPFGGQFPQLLSPEKPDIGKPEYFYADTKDEMKKAIRENLLYGAKVIKIVMDDQPYLYSVDDVKFIVDEAHRDGVKVAAHCWTDKGALIAAEGGVDSIEHGTFMTNQTLEIAKRNNVVLVGTEYTQFVADAMRQSPLHATYLDRLKRAYQVGMPMAFGSDLDLDIPGHSRGELAVSDVENYIEAGVPAKTALQIMTINGLRLLGIDKDRGEIRPGLAADIIATPLNPLDDLRTLEHVNFVMKDGKVFKQVK
ncbi:MAG TPA: amidohydrolase family protein [Candidatus Polarisedimenticolia bacterium]|nr:amidohydrolase family protein [Candidatus Polarisedimenticolia bacterium]